MAVLPVNITPLEYIQANGSSWLIVEGLKLDNEHTVKSKWAVGQNGSLYGSFAGGSASDNFSLYVNNPSTSASSWIRFGDILVQKERLISSSTKTYEFVQSQEGFFMDGTKICDFDKREFTSSADFYMFYLAATAQYRAHAKCYYLQILKSGVVEYDFNPAKNEETGEIGMWESVHKVFYASVTTTPFTAGEEKEGRIIGTSLSSWRSRLMAAISVKPTPPHRTSIGLY